jgi:hypothetical protein
MRKVEELERAVIARLDERVVDRWVEAPARALAGLDGRLGELERSAPTAASPIALSRESSESGRKRESAASRRANSASAASRACSATASCGRSRRHSMSVPIARKVRCSILMRSSSTRPGEG